jgi:hypothetical protein
MRERSLTRPALTVLSQMVTTAAIVATLVYLPACLAVALAFHVLGKSVDAWMTLGGALHPALGMLVWWLVVFLGSCGYAAWFFPWGEKVTGWPGRG